MRGFSIYLSNDREHSKILAARPLDRNIEPSIVHCYCDLQRRPKNAAFTVGRRNDAMRNFTSHTISRQQEADKEKGVEQQDGIWTWGQSTACERASSDVTT